MLIMVGRVYQSKGNKRKQQNRKKSKVNDLHIEGYTLSSIIFCAESDFEVDFTPMYTDLEYQTPSKVPETIESGI